MTNQQTKILRYLRKFGPSTRAKLQIALGDMRGRVPVQDIVRDLDVLEEKNLITCALNASGNHVRAK